MTPRDRDDVPADYEAGLHEIDEIAEDDSLTPRERIDLIRDTLDDVFGADDYANEEVDDEPNDCESLGC